jgi:SOUL heme-binding protein
MKVQIHASLCHPLRAVRAIVAAMLLSLFPATAMATEEPKFEVATSDGEFEVRQYAPMVVAETFVDGSQDDASSRGFRAIAGYIFGDNKRAGKAAEKIAMTAPVTIERQDTSQKIAMTAPVTLEQQGGRWRVHFVMPSQYQLADLPKPNNAAVTLREVPGRKVAAVRFSGFVGEDKVAAKTAELRDWVVARGLSIAGAAQLARYDAPWTPPFLRRNEILIEVK